MEPGAEGSEPQHTGALNNEAPRVVTTLLYGGVGFIQTYGWFLLGAAIIGVYAWRRLQSSWSVWQMDREQQGYKKHDVSASSAAQQRHLEAMEKARQRMQEQLNAQASIYSEKQQQKEEEKRRQKIEDWDRHLEGKGSKSKYKPKDQDDPPGHLKKSSKKPTLRPNDYNPLMGGSGASYFRPSGSRGGAGGG